MRLILMVIVFFISQMAYAEVIDFECKFNRYGAQYNRFLIDSKNDQASDAAMLLKPTKNKKWWQFWIKSYDDIQYFSIDVSNKKNLLTYYPVRMDIAPNRIIIQEYVNCSDSEVSSCKDWRFQYNINRVTGEITGFYKATDNSWTPYFKYGDIIYAFSGNCEPVKRKF